MGSMCSKRPIIIDEKRRTTKVSKVTDLRKKYEYNCMLGNGGFGKVRLYCDKFCRNMKYAIKTIKKENLGEQLREQIIEEVKILRELDHPNIVKYYETYEDEYYIHIVMEYLHGEDLFKVITMKKYNHYNEVDAAEIISYLLKALASIHNKGIVHRDLKPENILFSVPGDYHTLKIIDFGLSAHVVAKNRRSVGTPFYMAPEIIDGNFSFKTDIWSVGVILYVLMTGKFPFYGTTHDDVFEKIINEDYDLKELNECRCSDEVKDLISKMLVKKQSLRLNIEQTLEHPWFEKMKTRNEIIYKETTSPTVVQKIYDSIKKFTNDNLFKKEVLFYIAKISKDEEISKLKDAFILLDKDNTGTLTFDEILNAFKKVGLKAEKDEVDKVFQGLDFHKDGEVNYTEFLAATISSTNFNKEEKIWSAFRYFQSNTESGYITAESVIEALKYNGLKPNEDELNHFFTEQEGKKLDLKDFKRLVEM